MCGLDHAGPFDNVGFDASCELGGRVDDRFETKKHHLALVLALLHRACNLLVEFDDDWLRRASRDQNAEQVSDSWPANPASAMVGTSGRAEERFGVVTARPRSL